MFISTTPALDTLLKDHAPVAIGISGGKDSSAAACATKSWLDDIGHQGARILIHSDLGRIEWQDSLPTCERLARFLNMDLFVVKRQAGDLLDRWRVRWENNVARYATLSCVKLILPWSTPSMRFCTSEMKTALLAKKLIALFPDQTILSVSGIRKQESPHRAKTAIFKEQPKLKSVTHQTTGYDWNSILDWTLEDVWLYHQTHNLPVHEAYTRYGSSRVSCCFCIMSKLMDLVSSAQCEKNHDVYRELVGMEILTTFSFQDKVWLGDVAPHLLTEEQLKGVRMAKIAAAAREKAERQIPAHLLFTKDWPTGMPTYQEAVLLATIRLLVADSVGIQIQYTDPSSILSRYEELLLLKAKKTR